MATVRRLQFVHGQTAWMLAVILALVLVDAFSLELFFVLSLIGLLIVTQLTAPVLARPAWRSRLKWPILFGLLLFGVIVARRVLLILGWGG